MSAIPSQQPFNIPNPNHSARPRSKFNTNSLALQRRRYVLSEFSQRLADHQSFGDLQDPAKHEAIIKKRAPQLAKERRDE